MQRECSSVAIIFQQNQLTWCCLFTGVEGLGSERTLTNGYFDVERSKLLEEDRLISWRPA
jgi:hypothetical protein